MPGYFREKWTTTTRHGTVRCNNLQSPRANTIDTIPYGHSNTANNVYTSASKYCALCDYCWSDDSLWRWCSCCLFLQNTTVGIRC